MSREVIKQHVIMNRPAYQQQVYLNGNNTKESWNTVQRTLVCLLQLFIHWVLFFHNKCRLESNRQQLFSSIPANVIKD